MGQTMTCIEGGHQNRDLVSSDQPPITPPITFNEDTYLLEPLSKTTNTTPEVTDKEVKL